jgi:hypothetical protein
MFPTRYYGDRYFAPRYFAKVGEDGAEPPAATTFALSGLSGLASPWSWDDLGMILLAWSGLRWL